MIKDLIKLMVHAVTCLPFYGRWECIGTSHGSLVQERYCSLCNKVKLRFE